MSGVIAGIQYFIVNVVTDFVRWPFWWYSRGFILVGSWAFGSIKNYARSLAIGVWMKNLFVPMFGQRDWQSRLISIFMRSVQIFGRSIFLFIWAICMLLIIFVYIALPIVTVFASATQFLGLLIS